MTLTEQVTKNIINKLLKGEDYRIEIVTFINAEFLQFAIGFFKKVAEAKLNSSFQPTANASAEFRRWHPKVSYHVREPCPQPDGGLWGSKNTITTP